MWVAEIWRYSVKAMGESHQEALLTTKGIDGDRVVQMWGANGKILTRS